MLIPREPAVTAGSSELLRARDKQSRGSQLYEKTQIMCAIFSSFFSFAAQRLCES